MDDTIFELTEAFTVDLSNPTNATIADGQGIGTITDIDAPTVAIATARPTRQTEGTGPTITFTVTLSNAADHAITVDFATVNGTALAGSDYTAQTGSLTFAAGVTTQDIVVTVLNDAIFENPEAFTVGLSNATNGSIPLTIITPTGTGTIIDDDPEPDIPAFAIGDVTITEGDSGTQNMTFTVTRTGTSAVPIVLNFATSDGSALQPGDYTASTGTVTFAPGTDGTQTFTVPITNDLVVEGSDAFTVTLTPQIPSQVSGTSTLVATGTITDNDSATVSIATITDGAEPSANGLFRVTQSAVSATDTVISYSVDGASTATAGSDYTALSGTVTILAGQTTADISLPVLDDAIVEGTETVGVTLTSVSGDPQITLDATPANRTATVDIIDNDSVNGSATVSIATITDGAEPSANGLFRVTQSAVSATDTVISYSVDGASTATAGSDYTALSGTVTILAGQTTAVIDVPVVDDAIVEANETVSVTLTGITGGDPQITLDRAADLTATVTIADNDVATVSIRP